MNELITGDSEKIVSFICNLDRILEEDIERMLRNAYREAYR